jgi:hypothetical protein
MLQAEIIAYASDALPDTPRSSSRRRRRSSVEIIIAAPVVTTYRCVRRWQFWVFDLLPLLFALGISIEVFFLARDRETAQAADDFRFHSHDAHASLKLAVDMTLKNAQFLLSDMVANTPAPGAKEFERFAFSNPFFNMESTIAKVILVRAVPNASRAAYADPIVIVPDFMKPWGPQPRLPSPDSYFYYPIAYVSPPQPSLIGMDENHDPQLAPLLRLASGTGNAAVSSMYTLRTGLPTTNYSGSFLNGIVYVLPYFHEGSNGGLTTQPTGAMAGAIFTVIWITGVVERILSSLELAQMDVFLFDITDIDTPTYVAHYETPEADTRPYYVFANVSSLTPSDLRGDFVSDWTKHFDIFIAQRRFRMRAVARTRVYTASFSTGLPYILLGLSLGAKALDKFMHAIHIWKFNEHATPKTYAA